MGIKSLFFDKVEEEIPVPEEFEETPVGEVEPIDTVEVITIAQIYERVGLADKSRSIFKIEEFGAKFPKTLTQEVRKQSVLGVLEVAGFTLEELLKDATTRVESLTNILLKVISGAESEIKENEEKIKEAELLIETLKEENLNKLSLIEKKTNEITIEKNKIAAIVDFVAEREVAK